MSQIELTAEIKAKVDEAVRGMKEVGEETGKAMREVEDSTKKAGASLGEFVTSISGVMTAGFALYNALDRIQDKQLAVQKAQNSLTQAQISAKQAQDAYNVAVEKYGIDSDQARDAAEKLQLAQDRLATSQDNLRNKQDEVRDSMIQLAVQAIPTAITMISSLQKATKSLGDTFVATRTEMVAFSGTSGIGLVVGSIATLIISAGLMFTAWNENWNGIQEKTRTAVADIIENIEKITDKLNETLEPLHNFQSEIATTFFNLRDTLSSIAGDINNALDQIIDSFKKTAEEIATGSIWPEMWESITETTKEGLDANIDEIDRGLGKIRSLLKKPFYMEVVLNVNARAIQSQVIAIINKVLASVVIEKTSAGAVTSKIRIPTTTTTTTPTTPKSPMLTI